jgi:CheY-like chemotaxis protein
VNKKTFDSLDTFRFCTHRLLPARKRILVIENLPEVIPQLLRVSGHLVMSRNDRVAAEELWNKAAGGFDLVIIDDRTGAQTLIPTIFAYKPNIKIVLLSAKADPNLASSDNLVILQKPVSPVRLAEAVDS